MSIINPNNLGLTEDYHSEPMARITSTESTLGTLSRQFINQSDLAFTDISSEAERTYNFGQKGFVKVTNPVRLHVSTSGGHRIFAADGKSHYIPAGWIQLTWTAREGQPNFVK